MNKKEREQLLRDTLDQCLSGLDSLPSDRAEVNRRLTETMPEAKRRIRFRRLAVPAVALALCVCLIITGTHLGMIPWPDRIRPQETRVTAPPVALAQPSGEGTGATGDAVGKVESKPASVEQAVPEDFQIRAVEFFQAWSENDYPAMQEYCSPAWISAQEHPKQALFMILQNRTPSSFTPESVSGSPGDAVREITVAVSMYYNNRKPEARILMEVRMVLEDSVWYIDPESLVSYKMITTPEPMAEPSPTPTPVPDSERDPMDVLREYRPDYPADFVPVGLSCEKEGFRLELVSASVKETAATFIFSLQDLEGKRLSYSADPIFELPGSMTGQCREVRTNSFLYDEAAQKLTFTVECEYNSPEVLLNDTRQIPVVMSELYTAKGYRLSIGGLLDKYGDRASLVDVPQLIPTTYVDSDGSRDYGTAWYRDQGMKVLDYTRPLSVRLHKNLELSGIGLIDGLLHVQLHYVDNMVFRPDGSKHYKPIPAAFVYSPYEPFPAPVNAMQWDTDGDGQEDFIEYVYSCEEGAQAAKYLTVSFRENLDCIEGGWTIEVPLETVWTGDSPAAETEAPGPETTPEPEPEPTLEPEPSPKPEPELSLITRLQGSIPDCLADVVPVGLSCEKEGFRLEVVSASVKETAATFIFSMQDLEGDRLSSGVLPYVDMPNEDSGRYRRNLRTSLIYDHSSRKAFFAAEAQYDNPEILLDDAQQISLSVADLLIDRTITVPLGDFLSQYGDRAALVDLPELLPGHDMGPDGEGRAWTTDDYRELGRKVLDYTHPLSVRLHKNLELSGIGVVDGQLHVQLHYLDNQYVQMGRYTTKPISFLFVWRPRESDSPNPRMEWDTDGDGSADFVEFVYPCGSEADIADNLEVVFQETRDFIEGSWTIDIPLETVWTGDPDAGFLKPKAPEQIESCLAEFFDAWRTNRIADILEYCSPSWRSAQEDPRQSLFMILQNRTPSSCTVESVSGSPGDAVRDVTAAVSMYYNNRKPETPIRLAIRMVQEDNTWYIDPESLVSYRIIETPVPEQ